MGINSNRIRLHREFVWRNPLEHPFCRNATHMVTAYPSHLPAPPTPLCQASVETHRSHTSHCQNQERVHGCRSSQRTSRNIYIHTSHLLVTSKSLRIIITILTEIFFFCLFTSRHCIIKRIK